MLLSFLSFTQVQQILLNNNALNNYQSSHSELITDQDSSKCVSNALTDLIHLMDTLIHEGE